MLKKPAEQNNVKCIRLRRWSQVPREWEHRARPGGVAKTTLSFCPRRLRSPQSSVATERQPTAAMSNRKQRIRIAPNR